MKNASSAIPLALCVCLVWPCGMARAQDDGLTKLLRIMPSDVPMVVVVPDAMKLDRAVAAVQTRFKTSADDAGIVAHMKSEIGLAEWADLGRPIGVGVPAFGGPEWQGVLWLWIDDFTSKARGLPGATEANGVWELPFQGKETLFARVQGEYVAVSNTREAMGRASKQEQALTDVGGRVRKLLDDREVWIHCNVEPVRASALAAVAQFGQMAPLWTMMASAQGNADPAALTALTTAITDASREYMEQIETVDVFVGLSEGEADVTLVTFYKDGSIKSYLARQKPASVPLLEHLEEQPYFMAMGYHVPGDESPFFDYLLERIGRDTNVAPKPGTGTGTTGTLKEGMDTIRTLFRKLQGQNVVMGVSPGGMRMSGDYIGSDPKGLLQAVKESLVVPNPLTRSFNAGAEYEASGSKTVGNVTVDEFTVKVETTDPAAANMLAMYGGTPQLVLGVVGDRVRYYLGTKPPLQRVFAENIERPFVANKHVINAISSLPTKRNALFVIDPAGMLPLLGPMMGKATSSDVSPGPPIAISMCLAGEPARVDIHVPFQAIERVTQALGGNEGT